MKTKFILILTIVSLTLVSCVKHIDNLDIQSDIYFVSKYVNNVRVTGITYIFLGTQKIDSVVVHFPNIDSTITIKSNPVDYTLIKEPTDSEYFTQAPVTGYYAFEVTSALGKVYIGGENQDYIDLPGAAIASSVFNSASNYLRLTWNEVTQCDGYNVKMFDSSDKMIYNSNFISSDVTTLDVSTINDSGVWTEMPVNGQTYKIKIYTYIYDPDADPLNNTLDLQQVTIREKEVTWNL